LAARAVDHYVCVSEDCARLTVSQGIPEKRVKILHNGIDTRQFDFLGTTAGGPAVFVARLAPEKDAASLLRATAIVIRRQPSFRLVIAGDGVCMPDLRRLSTELALDGRVQFLGMVRDVAGALAGASLFVLSSVSEGVPLTLLEAMARGLPVVATEVGGIPEVVEHERTGLLVKPGDPAALADAMMRILDDHALAARMGEAGRRRIEQNFDIRRMVAAYERMYASKTRASNVRGTTITEDRHVALDDGADRGPGLGGIADGAALVAAARD
jgi:glycosyltransferase involved in cell wall biosynthesis